MEDLRLTIRDCKRLKKGTFFNYRRLQWAVSAIGWLLALGFIKPDKKL